MISMCSMLNILQQFMVNRLFKQSFFMLLPFQLHLLLLQRFDFLMEVLLLHQFHCRSLQSLLVHFHGVRLPYLHVPGEAQFRVFFMPVIVLTCFQLAFTVITNYYFLFDCCASRNENTSSSCVTRSCVKRRDGKKATREFVPYFEKAILSNTNSVEFLKL